jgi:hypothetical protein
MNLKQGQFYSKADRVKDRGIPKTAIFLFFAAIVWVANFWYSAGFGLYEDDWVRIPTVVGLNWHQIFTKVIFETSGQGRPFHDGLIFLFAFLGIKLGSLQYAYAIGFAIVTINAYLFYTLLDKIYANRVLSLTGALTFCLFPADTTRDYLTHSLGVQPSLTFLLTAFHCYVAGRKKLSYPIVFLCLIAYEPFFTVFFAAPLFEKKWNSKLVKEICRHGILLVAVIICAGILRKLASENQVSNFSPQSIGLLIFNPIVGSMTSLAMLVYRPLETLLKLDGMLLLFCTGSLLSFIYLLSYLNFDTLDRVFSLRTLGKATRLSKIPSFFEPYSKPIVTGVIALILAYPLTLTTVGFAISGRTTRVHAAAIIGVSLLSACICAAILRAAIKHDRKRLAILGIAGFFALLVGFGIRVQQDYQLMWQHQRGFWSDVVRLCPDLSDGTVIFVEPSGLRDTRQQMPFRAARGVSDPKQIKSLDWELPRVLDRIYQFPANWQLTPKAYRLESNWQEKILSNRGLFQVKAAIPWLMPDEIDREVESTNVILLETKHGQLTRRKEPLIIADRQFKLKERPLSALPIFEKKYLYDLLIQNPNEKPINYLISNTTSINNKTS